MADRPKTKPGTPKLSEAARHVVQPTGIVSTGWPIVRDKCAELGITFDDWQDGAGRLILAKRADGSYAAGIGGVVISIPRQVGKTFLVMAIVFALCLLNPGMTVLWTAHRMKTANETFGKMQSFCRRKKVKPHVLKIFTGSNDEAILFRNGSRVLFGAREAGFGRGFDDVDAEVFDEAQILTERATDDMIPAMNTAANPLPIFIGTPPKPSDPSEVFEMKRSQALSGEDPDVAYIEFSADRGSDPLDPSQWSKANPSYPKRTPESAMLRMIKNLTADSVRREALGIWDEIATAAASLIESDQWGALGVTIAPRSGTVAYGVKFSPDGMRVALSAAVRPHAGAVHVEGIEVRSIIDGTRWLVDWLSTRQDRVVIDGKAGAGALEAALIKAKVPARRIKRPTTDEAIAAHAGFVDAVTAADLSHLDDEVLASSIAAAGRRQIGKTGGWGFQSINGDDVILAESAVLAHWGAVTAPQPKPEGRTAVVM